MSKTFFRAGIVAACTAAAVGLAASVSLAAEVPEQMDKAAIPNYTRVSATLATAGQPTPEALASLREQGFRTVISLRALDEPGQDGEQEALESEGIRFVRVPVTPQAFSLEDVLAVEQVIDDAGAGPVLLHCGSANRVGGLWTVLQTRKGKSYAEAEAEGRAIGLRSDSMVAAVKRVLKIDPE